LKDAQKNGFSSLEEMKSMQAAGFPTKADHDAAVANAKTLGFDSLEEMKTLQAQGYQTKTDWNERYKKFGFESMEQMTSFNARGYATFNDYKAVKQLSPAVFYTQCKQASSEAYSANCMGKKISWHGMVRSMNTGDGVNITVKNDDGSDLKDSFSIDSVSLLAHVKKEDVGKRIEFEGLVNKQNYVTPDIESISYVQVESDVDRDKRLSKIKALEDKALEENASNATWLDDKFGTRAAIECGSGTDDYLRRVAKYKFQWDEMGWLSSKFNSYRTVVPEPGVMRYVSNKVSLQNGFGAFERMTMTCDYDTRQSKVLGYVLE